MKRRFESIQTVYKIAFLAFFWAACLAVLVQFVILPFILPQYHAGNGLCVGGDWSLFHQLAVDLAERVRTDGWLVWEIRPQTHAPAGIAAAFYILTGISKPWVLIPFNATLHALSASVLYLLLSRFFSQRSAVVGILPFVVFPSAMTWYTTMHKDSLFIAGCLLFSWSWVAMVDRPFARIDGTRIIKLLSVMVLGFFFVWIVRWYFIDVLQCLVVLMSVIFCIYVCFNGWKNIYSGREVIHSLAVLLMMILVSFSLFSSNHSFKSMLATTSTSTSTSTTLSGQWHHTSWFPVFVNNKLAHFAMNRDILCLNNPLPCNGKTSSEVDTDISFRSASDIIAYIPNALINGLIRPFPAFAFTHSDNGFGTLMRRVVGLEMIIVYIGLAGLLVTVWKLKNRISLILLVVACLVSILTYSMIYCNIGSLYRMRYSFLLTLTGIGCAQLFEMFFTRFTINDDASVPPVR